MADASRWLPGQASLGSANVVLLARSRVHYVRDFPGPLSLKTVLDGRVAWRTGNRHVWLDQSSFLVLNNDEPYSMQIDSPQPVTTCCVFFQHGFVESLRDDVICSANKRLDQAGTGRPMSFLSCLQPQHPGLAARMAAIRRQASADSQPLLLDEEFLNLAVQLLSLHKETERQMARIPAARAATRTELFARVARGREFLHTEAFHRVRLADAARAACMSQFHFHRTFLQAFDKTPSRYVTELRLQTAARLITKGVPVTESCLSVGFESLGSFCTKFRKHFGVPPSYFQR